MARHQRRKRPVGHGGPSPDDEPRPAEEDLCYRGDEPISAVDFTSGGAPMA